MPVYVCFYLSQDFSGAFPRYFSTRLRRLPFFLLRSPGMNSRQPNKERTDFLHAADQQRRAMQAAFTDLLAGAGLSGARPTEVGRHLGLDKTLAWKVSRVVEAVDPAET